MKSSKRHLKYVSYYDAVESLHVRYYEAIKTASGICELS